MKEGDNGSVDSTTLNNNSERAGLVHFAFRSAETGRYLFHAKYPAEDVQLWEGAAERDGQTLEEFINEALRRYLDDDDEPTDG